MVLSATFASVKLPHIFKYKIKREYVRVESNLEYKKTKGIYYSGVECDQGVIPSTIMFH